MNSGKFYIQRNGKTTYCIDSFLLPGPRNSLQKSRKIMSQTKVVSEVEWLVPDGLLDLCVGAGVCHGSEGQVTGRRFHDDKLKSVGGQWCH